MTKIIAGVDEAGRGSLAGPVSAAAVVLPPNHGISALADSKKLNAKKRLELNNQIKRTALSFAVAFIESEQIDKINILQASLKAMRQAVLNLAVPPDLVLIDGNICPQLPDYATKAIVNGDNKIAQISAASILAKVARDKKMLELDGKYPEYGFARHKGYGTKMHLRALASYGPSPLHRKSFAPIKRLCQ